jgi:hypothetical protein
MPNSEVTVIIIRMCCHLLSCSFHSRLQVALAHFCGRPPKGYHVPPCIVQYFAIAAQHLRNKDVIGPLHKM